LAFSWSNKPWFLTEGKFAAILIIPSSWGSQLDGDITSTPCRIKSQLANMSEEEFQTHFPLGTTIQQQYVHGEPFLLTEDLEKAPTVVKQFHNKCLELMKQKVTCVTHSFQDSHFSVGPVKMS
jgi:hypothetical protein